MLPKLKPKKKINPQNSSDFTFGSKHSGSIVIDICHDFLGTGQSHQDFHYGVKDRCLLKLKLPYLYENTYQKLSFQTSKKLSILFIRNLRAIPTNAGIAGWR